MKKTLLLSLTGVVAFAVTNNVSASGGYGGPNCAEREVTSPGSPPWTVRYLCQNAKPLYTGGGSKKMAGSCGTRSDTGTDCGSTVGGRASE